MAHRLTQREDGSYEMFSAGQEAVWHGLGARSAEAVTWAEAQRLGGLDWSVEKRKLYDQFGHELPAHGTFRTDKNGADGFLGCVGEDYEIIQNARMGEVLDTIIGIENGAHYETAGSIDGGRQTWAMLKLPTDIRVGDDISQNYLYMGNSHDGSMKAIVKLTSVRIVCANTLAMAAKDAGGFFKITHTKSAPIRMEMAMNAIKNVNSQIVSLNDVFGELAGKTMTQDVLKKFLETLYPEKTNKKGEDSSQNRKKKESITALFEDNDGNAFPEQRGTYFNALNAVTNFVDHHAPSRGDEAKNRAISALHGVGFSLKVHALMTLAQMAGVSTTALGRVI